LVKFDKDIGGAGGTASQFAITVVSKAVVVVGAVVS
jgi:hypothetical protein